MTYAERESILSKDIISTREIALLLDMKNESDASAIVKTIKLKSERTELLNIRGKVFTEDYLSYFSLTRGAKLADNITNEEET